MIEILKKNWRTPVFVVVWFVVIGVLSCSAQAAMVDIDGNVIPPDELPIPTIDKCVVGGEELVVLRKQMEKHYYYTYSIGGWYSEFEYWDAKTAEKNSKEFCRVYKSLYKAMT